jgi:hypothetical protein
VCRQDSQMIVNATEVPSMKQNDTAFFVLASSEARIGSEPRRKVLSGNLAAWEYSSVFTFAEFMYHKSLDSPCFRA